MWEISICSTPHQSIYEHSLIFGSGIPTGGQGGQSAPPDGELEKLPKIGPP